MLGQQQRELSFQYVKLRVRNGNGMIPSWIYRVWSKSAANEVWNITKKKLVIRLQLSAAM